MIVPRSSMDPIAVKVAALRKSYGRRVVLDRLSFEARRGEVLAILGPNGAGKTTLLEILEGFRSRDHGEVLVLGHDPSAGRRDMRERTGIVFQQTALEPQLNVGELFQFYQGIYRGARRPREVMEMLGISQTAEARIGSLSGGQQRRIALGLALLGNPDLLFLDEPTSGYDPEAIQNAWRIIRSCKEAGTCVILASHDMVEVEHVADRVGILSGGRFLVMAGVEQIRREHASETVISFRLPGHVDAHGLAAAAGCPVETTDSGRLEIVRDDPTPSLAALTAWAMRQNVPLLDLQVTPRPLASIYLDLLRRDQRDEPADD